jgi:DNA-binding GntR family transcriptional regulator
MIQKQSSLKISPQSLESQVADIIREQILDGQLSQGTRLKEAPIAVQFGLSRGTIRAALQQLCHEGLVAQVPHRGWTVTQLTMQDTWELYTLRNVLESFGARLMAESITSQKIALLKTALQEIAIAVHSKKLHAIIQADFSLHQTIIHLSGHSRLQTQYRLIEQQIRMYIACCDSLFPDLLVLLEEHEQLVEAICSGNGTLAEQTARDHHSDGKIFTWQSQVGSQIE